MKITREQIEALNPCKDGLDWYIQHGSEDLLTTLLDVNKYNDSYARWLFTRLMTHKQKRELAIFSAEQVLHIFEDKYPNDSRPRQAIEAAKSVLENDTADTRKAAAYAAYSARAAYAAARAACAAARAAADAAYAAAYAADAADAVYVDAAYAAAYSARAAYAAARAKLKMQEDIIRHAVAILERDSR